MASYIEAGAFFGGALAVPYFMGGNTVANMGKIVIHSLWGGSTVSQVVNLIMPQQEGQDDVITRISTLAHHMFFYGVIAASYNFISPQVSFLRSAKLCIVSFTVSQWAQNRLRVNTQGLAAEKVSDIRFYLLTCEAASTLFLSSIISGMTHSFFKGK